MDCILENSHITHSERESEWARAAFSQWIQKKNTKTIWFLLWMSLLVGADSRECIYDVCECICVLLFCYSCKLGWNNIRICPSNFRVLLLWHLHGCFAFSYNICNVVVFFSNGGGREVSVRRDYVFFPLLFLNNVIVKISTFL